MKKKLLSLLMAGAVVAGTAVPAHAQTYIKNESETIEANVTVTGTIKDQNGNAPAGKIQVEVPTTLTFTVDQKGVFDAAQYTITNKSQDAIKVTVGSFKETNKLGGITLKTHSQGLNGLDRSNIQLALVGNEGYVDLAAVNPDTEISRIDGGDSDNIQLLGAAGDNLSSNSAVDQHGESEDFELVFKIKKA